MYGASKDRRSYTDIPHSHISFTVLLLFFLIQPVQSVFNWGGVQAAAIPWSEPNGTADGFDWENGGSEYGLFGEPNLVGGNTFVFFPSNFRAESSDGQIVDVNDTLVFDLIAHTNVLITQIQITELGNYDVVGSGLVDLTGILQVQNLANPQTESVELVSTPPMPVVVTDDFASGIWSAEGALSFAGWTHLRVTLDNNLLAISDIGSSAFIQKETVGSAVAITIIPEPATICLLSLGALSLVSRKNDNKQKHK